MLNEGIIVSERCVINIFMCNVKAVACSDKPTEL